MKKGSRQLCINYALYIPHTRARTSVLILRIVKRRLTECRK